MRHWTKQELATLDAMRAGFLAGTAGERDYWRSEEDIALYDRTFAQRIGWKWDAVLRELQLRGWKPRSTRLFDWGCGSGIAGRELLNAFPGQFTEVQLWDRSPLAVRFAAKRIEETFSDVRVVTGSLPKALPPGTLLVLSHVISELPDRALAELLALAATAEEIIWVESGTHADSRKLTLVARERLRETFAAVGPCTHSARCGMGAPWNERHWCHFFAPIPPEVFQDSAWAEFSKELGIDLRSLPYSYIALRRPQAEPSIPTGYSRVIGNIREMRGHLKLLSCQADSVAEFILQKRDVPDLYKSLSREREELHVYAWELEEEKIRSAKRLMNSPGGGDQAGELPLQT